MSGFYQVANKTISFLFIPSNIPSQNRTIVASGKTSDCITGKSLALVANASSKNHYLPYWSGTVTPTPDCSGIVEVAQTNIHSSNIFNYTVTDTTGKPAKMDPPGVFLTSGDPSWPSILPTIPVKILEKVDSKIKEIANFQVAPHLKSWDTIWAYNIPPSPTGVYIILSLDNSTWHGMHVAPNLNFVNFPANSLVPIKQVLPTYLPPKITTNGGDSGNGNGTGNGNGNGTGTGNGTGVKTVHKPMAAWKIASIVIGSTAGLVLIGLVIWLVARKGKKKRRTSYGRRG